MYSKGYKRTWIPNSVCILNIGVKKKFIFPYALFMYSMENKSISEAKRIAI
jgi:hypothetical protein